MLTNAWKASPLGIMGDLTAIWSEWLNQGPSFRHIYRDEDEPLDAKTLYVNDSKLHMKIFHFIFSRICVSGINSLYSFSNVWLIFFLSGLWMQRSGSQTGKTTAIRRVADRETGVYRHHRGPIKSPLETPAYHSAIILRYLRGALNWNPIMPKDTSLTGSQCDFFDSGQGFGQSPYEDTSVLGTWDFPTKNYVSNKVSI